MCASSAAWRSTRPTASANSSWLQQLTPSRSSSFSVRLPIRSDTSSPDIPTCTARPAEATMSTIARTATGERDDLVRGGPHQRLSSDLLAELQATLLTIDHQHVGTELAGCNRHALTDRPGPHHDHLLAGPDRRSGDRPDRDRHRLGQRGD